MRAGDRMVLMSRYLLVSGVALTAAAAAVRCGSNHPPSAKTPASCTGGASQSMTSFTATPSTITLGDAFTLVWTAPCGDVTIAVKGQAPFALDQPSNGSYDLRSGLDGYPTAPGDTIYEATSGDVAQRLFATVNAQERGGGATPTPEATATPGPTPAPATCPAGSSCNDANPCTYDDRCQADNTTCRGTTYACCPGTSCDDGNDCTTNDVCDAGGSICRGDPIRPCCGDGTCESAECGFCETDCTKTCAQYGYVRCTDVATCEAAGGVWGRGACDCAEVCCSR